jgi:hypothetical protein
MAMTTNARPIKPNDFSKAVGRSLKRAAKEARRVARLHGTLVYVMKNGRVVAEKP